MIFHCFYFNKIHLLRGLHIQIKRKSWKKQKTPILFQILILRFMRIKNGTLKAVPFQSSYAWWRGAARNAAACLNLFLSRRKLKHVNGIEIKYKHVKIPSVNHGCVNIKLINSTTTNINGINILVFTFDFLSDNVGMRLTIKKVTKHINTEQNEVDLKKHAVFGKSNQIKIGIIESAAAAGAGTPTK